MREIKFRGKVLGRKQWVYGHYFVSPLTDENSGEPPENGWFFLSGVNSMPHHIIVQGGVAFSVDPKSIGLSTNKWDKNGNEIYENDILDVPEGWSGDYHEKRHLAVMEWDDDFPPGFYYCHSDDVNVSECRIVGNLYDNPTMIDYENAIKELNKEFPSKEK